MPKRRHDLDESTTSEPGGKRLRTDANGDTNGYIQNDSSNTEYWLVRKPKNVKIDDLPQITFPKKLTEEGRERKREGYKLRFSLANKQMFVLNRNLRTTTGNVVQNKPIGMIKGILNIEAPKPENEEDIGPIPPEEDYMNPLEEPETPEVKFDITSIRKPIPPVDDVTERLTAFGVPKPVRKSKKKKKKH